MNNDQIIKQSWQRCQRLGLDPSGKPSLQRLSQSDQLVLDEQYSNLIQTTGTEVLPYYQNILANTECLIVLADNHGHALNSWGDKRFIGSSHRASFAKGVDWREQNNGTNAIGTALVSGEAVQVLRDDHYLKANRFMIGSAAPIFDANRMLLGVLDISSDAYLPQAHTLGLVKLMSQSIENRLIINKFSHEHFLLTFNSNLDNLDSQWSGLVVFNEHGTIISANRRAELLLCYDLALVNITDIFDRSLPELKNSPEQIPITLRALGKYQMHGLVKRPPQSAIEAVDFRQQTPAKPSINMPKTDYIQLEQFSFGDQKIGRCIDQAQRMIDKDIPILIHGETGVGKEEFVKGLHHYSQRKNKPLVAVNCAAIPSELVESELFGYEKGAFTGASSKGAIGFIRKAHQGTLFLDEIGDMPLKVQSRLLRVLQERKVTPLGSTESYPVDIKLISATHRSLKADIKQGLFRQDLYYRVSGLNLELPPLRDRTDRRQLFIHINALHCDSSHSDGSPSAVLSDEVLNLFVAHPWPGNIRQLVSVIQIAQAMADQSTIEPWHLPDDFFEDLKQSTQSSTVQQVEPMATTGNDLVTQAASGDSDLELYRIYNEHKGNISKTARALNISRNTLYKRLKQQGIR
jgi:transcriptional regulator of acetoin/glycerol metabolism